MRVDEGAGLAREGVAQGGIVFQAQGFAHEVFDGFGEEVVHAGAGFDAFDADGGGDDGAAGGEGFEDFYAGAAAGAQGHEQDVGVGEGVRGTGHVSEPLDAGLGAGFVFEVWGGGAADDAEPGIGAEAGAQGGPNVAHEGGEGVGVGCVGEVADEEKAEGRVGAAVAGGDGAEGGDVGEDAHRGVGVGEAGAVEFGANEDAVEAGEEAAFEAGVDAGFATDFEGFGAGAGGGVGGGDALMFEGFDVVEIEHEAGVAVAVTAEVEGDLGGGDAEGVDEVEAVAGVGGAAEAEALGGEAVPAEGAAGYGGPESRGETGEAVGGAVEHAGGELG